MPVAVAASLGAALLLGTGMVLQALDARRVAHDHGLRLSLLARLVKRQRWVAGSVIGYLAFPLQVVAFRHGPLVLVQPVHACGLLLLLTAGGQLLRERASTLVVVGAAVMVAGLGMVAWGLRPAATTRRASRR